MKPGPQQTWDSMDPGVKYYAAACWHGATLIGADMYPINVDHIHSLGVIEMPQIYKGGKARKSDIADLIFAAGRLADRYEDYVLYLPANWKGQQPKKAHHKKILAALTDVERALMDGMKKGTLKHVLDAVGLGLHHLNVCGMRISQI